MEKELKWQKVKKPQPCWSGEIRVDTVNRRFIYENYYINADELFSVSHSEEGNTIFVDWKDDDNDRCFGLEIKEL